MAMLKTITVEDFYTRTTAMEIANAVYYLPMAQTAFGKDIPNFNMIPPEADALFSGVLRTPVTVDQEASGVFRIPELVIHTEPFNSVHDWMFVVALQQATFNLFEHQSGVQTVLEGQQVNPNNLFEWDIIVNYQLQPGQGVFFRPWLYHSFNQGLVNMFRLTETTTVNI